MVEIPHILRDFGVDPSILMNGVGIDESMLRSPDNMIPFLDVGRLVHKCVLSTKCRTFGLSVGQRGSLTHLGLVGQLMKSAASLGEALQDLCLNQRRYVRGTAIYVTVQNDMAILGYAIHHPGSLATDQICDGAIAIGQNFLRELADLEPQAVMLAHQKPRDTMPYQRHFNLMPQFDAEQNALVFAASELARPVRTADPVNRTLLINAVAEYWAARRPTLSEEVERILCARVVSGGAARNEVARDLGIHPRTLNRELKAEGTTFRDLLGKARFLVARQLLAGTDMNLTTISMALGYSEPSAFTNAFRRWSGFTPSAWSERAKSATS
jgi:AraC-like DNA-binding protein